MSAETRSHLLTRLLTAVRARGGRALLALGSTDHPVLYVLHRGRTVPVVVVDAPSGGRWLIWGRSSFIDAGLVDIAADHLTDAPEAHGRPTAAAPRHPALKAVA
ncbi:hypothetical protein O4J56_13800 [Nocardiopsis sp. RSe5-2]|uniref:Uncharacterized protein n=1 Tax=Nocardiopsis endophytica TaxID=3018445 RepID=A0ABT4U446_9ACTN|nr:hypothetical protein [Nocardiopsis endophytica]MDA2811710.1 hypothetical protein [Nocardiopsis endophytica]